MISPKYSTTHYFYPITEFASAIAVPHTVNLYLDYNCRFSARMFFKLKDSVIPKLEAKYPKKFQFVFVNVIQPWHPTSTMLHEFSLVLAKLLRDSPSTTVSANSIFWEFSALIFKNKEQFYDEGSVNLTRNEIYESIADLPGFDSLGLPFGKEAILDQLRITAVKDPKDATNLGNGASLDVKYFTKYLRGVGVHVTPTVSIDGIVNPSISSGDDIEKLVETIATSI